MAGSSAIPADRPVRLPAATSRDSPTTKPALLLTEWWPTAQAMQEKGIPAVPMHHDKVCTAHGALAMTSLRDGMYSMLWIDMPSRRLEKARTPQRWEILRTWIDRALDASSDVYLVGERGKIWDIDSIQRLRMDGILRLTHHHWCHFGVTLQPDSPEPSAWRITVMSNRQLTPHPCRCEAGVKHVQDWKLHHNGTGKLWSQAHLRFVRCLLASLRLPDVGTPCAPEYKYR